MNYLGTIIEESLSDKTVLEAVNTFATKIEPVTEESNTPWLKQWTLHKVEIPEFEGESKAIYLSKFLDPEHPSSWYLDFKNDQYHYIVFPDKVFKLDIQVHDKDLYKEAREYGIALGVPKHQLDFKTTL